jgi:8-oxo-dGTP diphosphatase
LSAQLLLLTKGTKNMGKKFEYDHPMPALVVDIVVTAGNGQYLLLVERKKEPWKCMKALPGGFVEIDETIIDAAARELREETSLRAETFTALGWWDKPDRDPRGRIVSHAFWVDCGDIIPQVKGMDDVTNARWYARPQFENACLLNEIAADHAEIVGNALAWGPCRRGFERLNDVNIRTGGLPRIG